MTIVSDFQTGVAEAMKFGKQIRLRYYNQSIGSVYDDDVSLTFQSDTWTSGVILAVKGIRGSFESVLMEQGNQLHFLQPHP